MHELSITKYVVDNVTAKANELNATKVCKVKLKVGRYYDYVPEIIQLYFDTLAEGTVAEGAVIVCEEIAGKDFYIENMEIED